MQNKGAIKLLAFLLAIACVYQLSFSFATRRAEKKAAAYAATYPAELQDKMEQQYLDSIKNLPVYSLGIVDYTYKDCQDKEINLGLDLKGGMNVMLEIQQGDVLRSLSENSQNADFAKALAAADEQMRSGSDDYIALFAKNYAQISGGQPLALIFNTPSMKEINANSTDAEVVKVLRKESDDAIAASYDILRSRIDRFGVTSPNIQRLPNSNRILVELPGIKEPERVRKLLQGTASLEFWETYNTSEMSQILAQADALLRNIDSAPAAEEAAGQTDGADSAEAANVAEQAAEVGQTEEASLVEQVAEQNAAEQTAPEEASLVIDEKEHPLFARLLPGQVYTDQNGRVANNPVIGYATSTDTMIVNRYLSMPQIRALFPRDARFMWSVKPYENKRAAAKGEFDPYDGKFELYAVKANTFDGAAPLDGSVITNAQEDYMRQGAAAQVSMTMNSEGIRKWAQLTGQNIGRSIAIALDGYIYSAPTVQGKIDGGQSQITGNFTINEAKDLANVLKSGKVRAPSRIIQDTVVGPSLGQESINAGIFSFIIAFILVLIYMGLYYKTAGWIACVALLTNLLLLMGVLVSFGAVLTLPGIAGIVLTMGMAVDANVIIYERIKEELRAGKGLSLAIHDGYSNAYSAIIDGQLTTIITGIVLFIFGNGPVQGFATTLIIGIITSVFTSIFITRLIIDARVSKGRNVAFSRKWSENMLANADFDFIGKRRIAYIISGTLLLLSIGSFFVRGFNKGVEFTGGRAYVVRFDQTVSADAVRKALEGVFPGDAKSVSLEVKQYGGDNQMRIVTQYKYDDTSEEATAEVDQLLYNALKGLFSYDITLDGFKNTQDDVNGIISADKIGPSIARDMTRSAVMAVIFSLIAIALYIILRFKKWQWGMGAVVSLTHNALLVMGLFSLLYGLLPFALEVNQSFIAAILTIIGYSINDTVVIFDRIREFSTLYPKRKQSENINKAINSTLSRTLNTSGTTIVTLLAIFIFGGETIRGFVFALMFGVIVGTYSSVFVATPVAYEMMRKSKAVAAGK